MSAADVLGSRFDLCSSVWGAGLSSTMTIRHPTKRPIEGRPGVGAQMR